MVGGGREEANPTGMECETEETEEGPNLKMGAGNGVREVNGWRGSWAKVVDIQEKPRLGEMEEAQVSFEGESPVVRFNPEAIKHLEEPFKFAAIAGLFGGVRALRGEYVEEDSCSGKWEKVGFARVKLEMSINFLPVSCVSLDLGDGRRITQEVVYELRISFCDLCGALAHTRSTCKKFTAGEAAAANPWTRVKMATKAWKGYSREVGLSVAKQTEFGHEAVRNESREREEMDDLTFPTGFTFESGSSAMGLNHSGAETTGTKTQDKVIFRIVAVYMPNNPILRRNSFAELTFFLNAQDIPTLIYGDFNAMRNSLNKTGLIAKFEKKMAPWKTHLLSYAGRACLITHNLSSMGNFWMQSSSLPNEVLKKLERCMAGFLWADTEVNRHIHQIAWHSFCKPKAEGGIGLRLLEDVNASLLATNWVGWKIGDGKSVFFWSNWWHDEILVKSISGEEYGAIVDQLKLSVAKVRSLGEARLALPSKALTVSKEAFQSLQLKDDEHKAMSTWLRTGILCEGRLSSLSMDTNVLQIVTYKKGIKTMVMGMRSLRGMESSEANAQSREDEAELHVLNGWLHSMVRVNGSFEIISNIKGWKRRLRAMLEGRRPIN
ncbi:putative ribonuclease H protein [Nymphaea thermarum]|nr:putative ribonuclease H protein [Nymphaea thermarum]